MSSESEWEDVPDSEENCLSGNDIVAGTSTMNFATQHDNDRSVRIFPSSEKELLIEDENDKGDDYEEDDLKEKNYVEDHTSTTDDDQRMLNDSATADDSSILDEQSILNDSETLDESVAKAARVTLDDSGNKIPRVVTNNSTILDGLAIEVPMETGLSTSATLVDPAIGVPRVVAMDTDVNIPATLDVSAVKVPRVVAMNKATINSRNEQKCGISRTSDEDNGVVFANDLLPESPYPTTDGECTDCATDHEHGSDDSMDIETTENGDRGKKWKKTGIQLKKTRKKRIKRVKDFNAPKPPISDYLHFLKDNRERARKENPTVRFKDVMRLLGIEWNNLSPSKRQEYKDISNDDRERYRNEMIEYKKTDTYQSFVDKNPKKGQANFKPTEKSKVVRKRKCAKDQETPKQKKALMRKKVIPKKVVPEDNTVEEDDGDEDEASTQEEVDLEVDVEEVGLNAGAEEVDLNAGVEEVDLEADPEKIHIFNTDFLSHNKAQEIEIRKLRNCKIESEEQNSILKKHNDNMKSAIQKIETDIANQKIVNASLAESLAEFQAIMATVALPDTGNAANNISLYLAELHSILFDGREENEELVASVKTVIEKLNLASKKQ